MSLIVIKHLLAFISVVLLCVQYNNDVIDTISLRKL